jgi:hypothetical protein
LSATLGFGFGIVSLLANFFPSETCLLEKGVVLTTVFVTQRFVGGLQATIFRAHSSAMESETDRFVVLSETAFRKFVDEESHHIGLGHFPVCDEIVIGYCLHGRGFPPLILPFGGSVVVGQAGIVAIQCDGSSQLSCV